MNQVNINADTTIISDIFRRISDTMSGRLSGEKAAVGVKKVSDLPVNSH
ncbi:MAG: hypothetical protein HOB52_05495 [Euryarchaeota archaeon]|jgi:hypothetical protein|nr:hypothetical protein [Euryarchaeota archaeon]